MADLSLLSHSVGREPSKKGLCHFASLGMGREAQTRQWGRQRVLEDEEEGHRGIL